MATYRPADFSGLIQDYNRAYITSLAATEKRRTWELEDAKAAVDGLSNFDTIYADALDQYTQENLIEGQDELTENQKDFFDEKFASENPALMENVQNIWKKTAGPAWAENGETDSNSPIEIIKSAVNKAKYILTGKNDKGETVPKTQNGTSDPNDPILQLSIQELARNSRYAIATKYGLNPFSDQQIAQRAVGPDAPANQQQGAAQNSSQMNFSQGNGVGTDAVSGALGQVNVNVSAGGGSEDLSSGGGSENNSSADPSVINQAPVDFRRRSWDPNTTQGQMTGEGEILVDDGTNTGNAVTVNDNLRYDLTNPPTSSPDNLVYDLTNPPNTTLQKLPNRIYTDNASPALGAAIAQTNAANNGQPYRADQVVDPLNPAQSVYNTPQALGSTPDLSLTDWSGQGDATPPVAYDRQGNELPSRQGGRQMYDDRFEAQNPEMRRDATPEEVASRYQSRIDATEEQLREDRKALSQWQDVNTNESAADPTSVDVRSNRERQAEKDSWVKNYEESLVEGEAERAHLESAKERGIPQEQYEKEKLARQNYKPEEQSANKKAAVDDIAGPNASENEKAQASDELDKTESAAGTIIMVSSNVAKNGGSKESVDAAATTALQTNGLTGLNETVSDFLTTGSIDPYTGTKPHGGTQAERMTFMSMARIAGYLPKDAKTLSDMRTFIQTGRMPEEIAAHFKNKNEAAQAYKNKMQGDKAYMDTYGPKAQAELQYQILQNKEKLQSIQSNSKGGQAWETNQLEILKNKQALLQSQLDYSIALNNAPSNATANNAANFDTIAQANATATEALDQYTSKTVDNVIGQMMLNPQAAGFETLAGAYANLTPEQLEAKKQLFANQASAFMTNNQGTYVSIMAKAYPNDPVMQAIAAKQEAGIGLSPMEIQQMASKAGIVHQSMVTGVAVANLLSEDAALDNTGYINAIRKFFGVGTGNPNPSQIMMALYAGSENMDLGYGWDLTRDDYDYFKAAMKNSVSALGGNDDTLRIMREMGKAIYEREQRKRQAGN